MMNLPQLKPRSFTGNEPGLHLINKLIDVQASKHEGLKVTKWPSNKRKKLCGLKRPQTFKNLGNQVHEIFFAYKQAYKTLTIANRFRRPLLKSQKPAKFSFLYI